MSRGYTGRHRGAPSAPADTRTALRPATVSTFARSTARPIGSFAVVGVVVAASATGLSAASATATHPDGSFVASTASSTTDGFDLTAAIGVPRSTASDAGLTAAQVRVVNAIAVDEVVAAAQAQADQAAAQAQADQAAAAQAQAAAQAKAVADALAQRQAAAAKASRDAARQAAPADPGTDPRVAARAMLANYGWTDDQFSCVDSLFSRESQWNYKARNASSGAYGIPQALPGSKMASAGADWQTNPVTQIAWGLGYIKGRYGSPCNAWAHSQATGWY